jgi:hypothetical protein
MIRAREYRHVVPIGPGGLRCPCCSPHHCGHSQKATKRFINRKWRRRAPRLIAESLDLD